MEHELSEYGSSGDDENRNFRASSPPRSTFSSGAVLLYRQAAACQWSEDDMDLVVNITKDWTVDDLKAMVELRGDPQFVAERFHGYRSHEENMKAVLNQEPVLDGELKIVAMNFAR
jgi:hypothetical protein